MYCCVHEEQAMPSAVHDVEICLQALLQPWQMVAGHDVLYLSHPC